MVVYHNLLEHECLDDMQQIAIRTSPNSLLYLGNDKTDVYYCSTFNLPGTPWADGNTLVIAEFQQVVMGLKREHKESLEKVQQGQEVSLFNLRGEQAEKLCQYETRIRELEMEVEKLRTFSAIEVSVPMTHFIYLFIFIFTYSFIYF